MTAKRFPFQLIWTNKWMNEWKSLTKYSTVHTYAYVNMLKYWNENEANKINGNLVYFFASKSSSAKRLLTYCSGLAEVDYNCNEEYFGVSSCLCAQHNISMLVSLSSNVSRGQVLELMFHLWFIVAILVNSQIMLL